MRRGLLLRESFLNAAECKYLIGKINEYRKHHTIPFISRSDGDRPLRYFVIDGERIKQSLPAVMNLYRQVTEILRRQIDEKLTPLPDTRVGCNINITPARGSYRFHYDRNPVTAILYLNETRGGEIECYPNYRLPLTRADSRVRQAFDRLLQTAAVRWVFGHQFLIRPRAGRLVVMRGDCCLHSVCPVLDQSERLNIVMAYSLEGMNSDDNQDLNAYLYDQRTDLGESDPNYR